LNRLESFQNFCARHDGLWEEKGTVLAMLSEIENLRESPLDD
jgi:hypothetical protein